MTTQHLKNHYLTAILLNDDYPHVKNIGYELLNATGHIRLRKAERLNA